MAHFRWFQHGAETALEGMASSRELFLLTQCDDGSLICIYSKIKVTNRRNDDSNSQHGVVELDLIDKEEYFYRFHYDEGTRNSQTSQYTKLTTCRFDATHHTVNAVRGSQRCLALRRQES
jgi:hypothetical protein